MPLSILKLPTSARAITIPSNALLFRSEGLRAAVLRNGHVALTPITIGEDYGSAGKHGEFGKRPGLQLRESK
jgi:hypothetical protein